MERQRFSGSTRVPRQVWVTTRAIKHETGMDPDDYAKRYAGDIRKSFPGKLDGTATPVLICALNEKENLGRTFKALARYTRPLQPVVVDNNSTDGTGEYAEKFGAVVVKQPQPGLLNALRAGFAYLGEKAPTSTVLLTDADSLPLPAWGETLVQYAQEKMSDGGIASGRIMHYDRGSGLTVVKNGILSTGANVLDSRANRQGKPRAHGPNTVMQPDESGDIYAALTSMEPSDEMRYYTDVQVLQTVQGAGGEVGFCNDPRALVVTSGRRYEHMRDVFGRVAGQKVKERVYKGWSA